MKGQPIKANWSYDLWTDLMIILNNINNLFMEKGDLSVYLFELTIHINFDKLRLFFLKKNETD